MELEHFPDARILIVDDYPGNIEILRQALPETFQVRTALSGQEALDLLQQNCFQPDLILLDVMMPDLDGYEVCRILKQDARLRDIPVIFVSALTDVQSKINGLNLGVGDYITKPFNFKEIRLRVGLHLKLRRLNQEMTASNRQLEVQAEKQVQNRSRSQLDLISALASWLAWRDPVIDGHLDRACKILQILVRNLKRRPTFQPVIDDWFSDQLVNACPLHDIGKIAIPMAILNKPSPLTADEMGILAEHTRIGAATLSEVRDQFPGSTYLDMAIDMARSHHERWDGNGYPDRLAGDAIPLAAQILALALFLDDHFTRLSDQHARLLAVRESILAESGHAFSPRLVEVCLDALDEIDALCFSNRPAVPEISNLTKETEHDS